MYERRLLMIPGPTNVDPRVLRAMMRPIINHRSQAFGKILTETCEMMKTVFRTENDVFLLTGSGTAGMEAAIANIIEPGDKVLCAISGKFGQRFKKIVETFGGNPIEVSAEWGQPINPDDIKRKLEENPDTKAVTLVFNETSTATKNPVKEIGDIVKDYDALFIVDTISALSADEFYTDKYNVDICVNGSQKDLAAPPGISPIAVSEKAWEVIDNVEARTYYLSLRQCKEYFNRNPPQTPYTPAIPLFYALNEALKMVLEEGLEKRIKRHEKIAKAVRAGIRALGLSLFANQKYASNTVTAINIPEGITDSELRGKMREKYGIEVAGGQDHLKGKIFRIGHMGTVQISDILQTIGALELILKESGLDIEPGSGVSAVEEVYLQ
ncbi:MAG: pyridoxal-phosphate-dependent aminotransferase family protein [Candidatus Hydrothermarchaeota archaeon]